MTEYELVSLVTDLQGTIATTVGPLFTVISAFLVAGFVAAHRLSALMIVVVLGVYTLAALLVSIELNRELAALIGVAGEVQDYAAAGKGLGWHPAAGWTMRESFGAWMTPVQVVVGLAVYASTIGFFFNCRHLNQRAGAGS